MIATQPRSVDPRVLLLGLEQGSHASLVLQQGIQLSHYACHGVVENEAGLNAVLSTLSVAIESRISTHKNRGQVMDKHELSNNVIAFSYKVRPQLYAGGFLLFYPPRAVWRPLREREADCYLLFALYFYSLLFDFCVNYVNLGNY